MRFVLLLLVISFIGMIAMGTLGYFLCLFATKKKIAVAEGRRMATEASNRNIKSRITDTVNRIMETKPTPINLEDSINITQYGNDVLKNVGDLANYMYDLSQNSILETTSSIIAEISGKKGFFSDDDYSKYNFVAHYTKDRLLKQVSSIEQSSKKYEQVFKDFDKIIKHAEHTVETFKPIHTNDAYENEIQNNKKANINLLKNKIVNLKKSKLYHQQALAQLKVMLGLNNNLIVEFDNIIHQMLPLIKNNASIESFKALNMNSLSKQIEKLRKLNEIKP